MTLKISRSHSPCHSTSILRDIIKRFLATQQTNVQNLCHMLANIPAPLRFNDFLLTRKFTLSDLHQHSHHRMLAAGPENIAKLDEVGDWFLFFAFSTLSVQFESHSTSDTAGNIHYKLTQTVHIRPKARRTDNLFHE